ncbi:aliphatic sulfonate ABC transporter substrate-binding protein [Salimicrobium flavidum]|uniref:Putative aliphatic sulfonates-binding protein n=1 Tax=Salimicrobium flavidum TaxID=570947 RepID=A0A1N7K7K3_9BACI|nr:aliphatic sulfonate ABC transporter substrate-binding protein [Salimicrobium flavidum]SIS57550.1 sulfonate transport system substrate-binding protein [Salimicrobium flavidum]
MNIKNLILTITIILLGILVAGCSSDADGASGTPEKITLDYAYYSPTSLVLKEKGFVEEVFGEEVEVEYVLSQGSNKALEFLNSSSVDFSSSAGAAALMSKANGAPVETVYLYSKPEWTALVSGKDSGIDSVEDLRGKKVAATLGTDPYIFLERALKKHDMSTDDIELVNLQHPDGASALSNGDVDAWAGLDPHMAREELESGANLFYRDADLNTYGTLNTRTEFAENNPDVVKKVIEAYEKARQFAIDNPEETAEILAAEAELDLEVAKQSLERNDFSNAVPNQDVIDTITAAGDVLQDVEVIDQEADIDALTEEMINPSFAEEVIE